MEPDDRGLHETRGLACEVVAWRLLTYFSEREVIDHLLYEFPNSTPTSNEVSDAEQGLFNGPANNSGESLASSDEHTRLLSGQAPSQRPGPVGTGSSIDSDRTDDTTTSSLDEDNDSSAFNGLNALEIAAVAGAKTFLSQRVVQKVVNGIWCGDIVFWESLSVHTKKKAQLYNDRYVRFIRSKDRQSTFTSFVQVIKRRTKWSSTLLFVVFAS